MGRAWIAKSGWMPYLIAALAFLLLGLGSVRAQQADLEIQMWSDNGGTVLAGEQLKYYIIVTNWGPDAADNVEIRDQLTTSYQDSFDPNGCTLAIRSTGGAITSFDCNFALSSGIFELARVGATSLVPIAPIHDPNDPSEPIEGNQAQVIVTIEGTAQEAMSLNNLVTVTSDTPDPDTSNNTATDFLQVNAASDLSLTLGSTPSLPATAGTDVTFRFDVANEGPSTSLGTMFEAALPAGLIDPSARMLYDDGSDAPGGCAVETSDGGGWLLTCGLGVVSNSDDAAATDPTPFDDRVRWVEVTGAIASDRVDPLAISATVWTDSTDLTAENDRASLSVPVDVASALDVELDGPSSIEAGSQASYTVRVTNGGPSLARNARMTLSLPEGLSVTSATVVDVAPTPCAVGSETRASDTATCALRDIGVTSHTFDERMVKVNVALSADVEPDTVLQTTATATANGGSASASEAHTANATADTTPELTARLRVAPGPSTPEAAAEPEPGDTDVPVLQFSLEVPDGSDTIMVDAFELVTNSASSRGGALTTSAVELSDLAGVHVYADDDGDGEAGPAEEPLGTATSMDVVNGVIAVSLADEIELAAGDEATFLLTFDVADDIASSGGALALALLVLPFGAVALRRRRLLAAIVLLAILLAGVVGCSQQTSTATSRVTLETRLTTVHAQPASIDTDVSVTGVPLQARTVVVERALR